MHQPDWSTQIYKTLLLKCNQSAYFRIGSYKVGQSGLNSFHHSIEGQMIIVSTFLTRMFSLGRGQAVVVFPFIFLANVHLKSNQTLLQHEKIHYRQAIEMLVVGFYLWYLIEFVIRYVQYKNWDTAYRAISLEKEAYTQEKTPKYLHNRGFWAFKSYL
jgi:hypothetical protein